MTKHSTENLESELALIEQQLKLVTEFASSQPTQADAEFLDNEPVLSGRVGFKGINWDKPEEKGQKILAGRTFALVTVPSIPEGPTCVEIVFRRFRSAQVPTSMKVFLNGEQLLLTQRGRKGGHLTKMRSRLSKYFPSLYQLEDPPYVFRSQLLFGSHRGDNNILTFHFSPRSLRLVERDDHSLAMVISISFKAT